MFDVLGSKKLINIHCYSCFILESKYQSEKKPKMKTPPLSLTVCLHDENCAVDFSALYCTYRYQSMKSKDNFNLIAMLKGNNISIAV